MRKSLFILAMILSLPGLAQQLPMSNQYLINPVVLNPAFTGHSTNYEAFIGYQRYWAGIANGPELKLFNLNGPIAENMGIGGGVMDDQVGIFRNLNLHVNYAYHLQVGEASKVSFGTSVAFIDQHIEVDATSAATDPAVFVSQGSQRKHFNAGVGINYNWKNLNVGVNVPYLLQNETSISDTGASYIQSRHYWGHARYDWQPYTDWTFSPVLVAQLTNVSNHFEGALMVRYKKLAWMSLAYQKGNTINLSLGGLPLPYLAVQYTYGLGGSGMMAQSGGNHEVGIGLMIGRQESSNTSIFNRKVVEKRRGYYKWIHRRGTGN